MGLYLEKSGQIVEVTYVQSASQSVSPYPCALQQLQTSLTQAALPRLVI